MTNCPNCGSPLEPYKCKCEYCGTWYYDLSMFDLDDGKPQYVKFKTNMNGREIYITALTKPHLESMEVNNDTTDIPNRFGNILYTIATNRYADINVRFSCLRDGETESLFQVVVKE